MNELKLTERQFDLFKDFVYRESGICFNVINKVILESRIASSMKEKNIEQVEDYYKLVSSDKEELNVQKDTNIDVIFRFVNYTEENRFNFPTVEGEENKVTLEAENMILHNVGDEP